MTVNTRRFFLPLHSSFFFPFKITLAVFFLQNYTRRFFQGWCNNYTRCFFNAILRIHATFFQCNNYTRRFLNAIITRDVFSKNYTRRFLELRFKLRVSLRTKMGAIIRLVCLIKTKNHVNTVHMARNQICISRWNMASAVNTSKLLITRCCKSQNQRIYSRSFATCLSRWL
jgi:hypothetical protein